MWRTRDWRKGSRWLCAAAWVACPAGATAQALAFSLQPSVAVGGGRQTQAFRLPSAASIKALLGINRYLDVSFGAGFVGLPNLSDSNSPMSGMASTVGAGLRFKRPHDERSLGGASPWADAEVLSVHGGDSSRRALAVGAGLAFPMGRDRRIWVGPFVRYLQLLERNGVAHGQRASDGVFAGLTFEIGSAAGPVQ